MPEMDRKELWLHLEQSLTSLVNSITTGLDDESREIVIDFIEDREFGVALEWLYSIIVERNLLLSEQQNHEINRLAALMKIDLSKVD
jgi:hypothetical protein